MLNLSSPSDQILKEVIEEREKALYWHEKINHKKLLHKQLVTAYTNAWKKKPGRLSGFHTEYVSPSGNKWLTFEIICPREDDPEKFRVMYCPIVYYETAASIGCFQLLDENSETDKRKVVHIYTSHFFQRYCERLGVPFGSKEMLIDFTCDVCTSYYDEITDSHGKHEVIRIPHRGVAMAIPRKDNPSVVEIRTFLADSNLNTGKQKKLESLMECSDSVISASEKEILESVVLNY